MSNLKWKNNSDNELKMFVANNGKFSYAVYHVANAPEFHCIARVYENGVLAFHQEVASISEGKKFAVSHAQAGKL